MFGQTFYFSTIRKYVILVGTLFNDLHITKTDKNGNVTGLIEVPVTYGPKDKMLARVVQDPELSRQSAMPTLPIISFEMGQIKYDGSRKLHTLGRSSVKNDANKNTLKYQYNPVPYNFDFKVYIYAKNAEDGTKIIEQILPYFTPDWTTTIKLIPEMDIIMDIPVVLNNVSYEDKYDGDFKQRRSIVWTLDLLLKGYVYGPVRKSNVIKFANTSFYMPNVPDGQLDKAIGNTPRSEYVTVQPGLTVTGQPTSNIELTIPYGEIEVDNDYGFVTQIYNEE